MKSRIGLVTLAVGLSFGLGSAEAQAPKKGEAKPAPESQTGLEVGAKAPGFKLKDQGGTERTLEGLLAKGNVAVVFYRSADW